MTPTGAAFEERVANLEGGSGGVAFASGIAAQAGALFTLLQPGDHVVSSSALYGGTVNQFKHYFRKLSVELTFVDPDDLDAWKGADNVVHSATKFIGGHGTSIGGVVVESGVFDWSNGRFPVVADPSPAYHGLSFHETFGMYGYLMKLRAETLRDLGASMSPFNAFLFLQGLETLSLRMDRHVSNALAVAKFLEAHPMVERVTYPGLASSRYRPPGGKYLPKGAGAVFSFDIAGGREAGQNFIRGVSLWSHLANVGDAKSLIIHPASTTHRQLQDDELSAAGVSPGTIRLSVGIEDVDDLIWDLQQGFRAAKLPRAATAAAVVSA